jgi:hypothetical protein
MEGEEEVMKHAQSSRETAPFRRAARKENTQNVYGEVTLIVALYERLQLSLRIVPTS